MDDKLNEALIEYLQRRDRESDPLGGFDRAGRWYPCEAEFRECCRTIREPSRNYPYSLLVHCRSLRHVAHLYGVDESELRRLARRDYDKRVQKLEDGNE